MSNLTQRVILIDIAREKAGAADLGFSTLGERGCFLDAGEAKWRLDVDSLQTGLSRLVRDGDVHYSPQDFSDVAGVRLDLIGTTHAASYWIERAAVERFLTDVTALRERSAS